jgi:hypothetical protein
MAKCPTCDTEIAWDAPECRICLTVFGDSSQWKPIGESREEKQSLRQRYGGATPGPSNPYAPPDASVDDVAILRSGGRPVWVWLITIVFGIGTAWSIVWMLLVLTNAIPMYAEGGFTWNRLSVGDVVIPLINSSLSLCGLILLFQMRARATAFLTASLVMSVAGAAYSFATKNMVAALGTPGIATMAISYVVWGGVVWYAYHLRSAGRLR